MAKGRSRPKRNGKGGREVNTENGDRQDAGIDPGVTRDEMEEDLKGQFGDMLDRLDNAQLERLHRYWPTFQRSLMQIVEMVTAGRKEK